MRPFGLNAGANNGLDESPDKVIAPNNPSGFLKYSQGAPFGMNGVFDCVHSNEKF
jgi:hypothetical protein